MLRSRPGRERRRGRVTHDRDETERGEHTQLTGAGFATIATRRGKIVPSGMPTASAASAAIATRISSGAASVAREAEERAAHDEERQVVVEHRAEEARLDELEEQCGERQKKDRDE